MENITAKIKDGMLYLMANGRIDSANSAQTEALITKLVDENKGLGIIIDADELQYISSAGLRVVLRLRKSHPELKIINAAAEVYEIFEMTGFTEMIPVEKAYRKLSVEGCEAIGQGANGMVYRLDPDTIIKVYLNPDSLPDIHRERELARRAFVLGVPTAIPYDVVKVGTGYGSVFELLNATSLAKLIKANPEKLDEAVAMYVELLQTIHGTTVNPEDMPDMKAIVLNWADFLKDYLPADKWQKLHDLIDAVPVEHRMLHGDYHTKNVMLQGGEALLIDMDTLAQGNPVFEFASVFNACKGFYLPYTGDMNAECFMGYTVQTSFDIWDKTIRLYFGTDDEARLAEIEDKAKLVGFTRLMRRLIRRQGLETAEGRAQIEYYKNEIETLVEKIDSLIF